MKKYLLEELCQHEFALPFMEPVDTKALNVPSYYTIIEHPMDVGTIAMRVENRYYCSVNELIDDVRLVISNCFTFNMPGSIVYRDGEELEKLFMKVLEKLPIGDEVPYDKEKGEKSIMKRQCRFRLKKLQDATEQLEQDAQAFFDEKWFPIAEALNTHSIKSLDDFDNRLDNILKHCQDHGKRILETYDYEANRLSDDQENKDAENASDEMANAMCQCQKPPFDWEDNLIDALDDALTCLKQDLAKSRRGELRDSKICYSQQLLPIFVNAQIISEGLCSQTNLSDSSEEEETDCKTNRVSLLERQTIRSHFSELLPEAKFEIMHIVEQAEYRSGSNADRKYNMMYFSPQTILLIKKAIDKHRQSTAMDAQYFETMQEDGTQDLYESDPATEFVENMSQDIDNDNDDEASDESHVDYGLEQQPQMPNYYANSPEVQQEQNEANPFEDYAASGSVMEWEARNECDSDGNHNSSDSEIVVESANDASPQHNNLMDIAYEENISIE